MTLKVSTEKRLEGAYLIRPVGSIDANTFMDLAIEVEKILKTSPRVIIFDMKDVDYVSSAGITTVLEAESSLKLKGGKVLLLSLQPSVRKVFDIVQALPPQRIFTSIEELDNYLMEIQRKVKEGEM